MPHYRVLKHGELLGTLTRIGGDFPWYAGIFVPAPGFEPLRHLFDRERELLEADTDPDAWAAAWDELEVGLVLEPTDGRDPITEFLLHIDGDSAQWRL